MMCLFIEWFKQRTDTNGGLESPKNVLQKQSSLNTTHTTTTHLREITHLMQKETTNEVDHDHMTTKHGDELSGSEVENAEETGPDPMNTGGNFDSEDEDSLSHLVEFVGNLLRTLHLNHEVDYHKKRLEALLEVCIWYNR